MNYKDYEEKTIIKIEIKKTNHAGYFVDIIDNNYNIITNTIYDEELAKALLKAITEAQ